MKEGYRTTEFWLTIAATVLPLLSGEQKTTLSALLSLVAPAVYTAARTWLKSKL